MTQLVIQHYRRPAARRSLLIGLGMMLFALAFAVEQAGDWLIAHPNAAEGLRVSLLAGLATGLGAIPALLIGRPREAWMPPLLGLAGGMMLASVFSLLWPAMQIIALTPAPAALAAGSALALIAGALAMQAFDRQTRHSHVETIRPGKVPQALGFVVAAIALHNFPEGLAVGLAAASGVDHGMSAGIALQNIPEGWIVASALMVMGSPPWRAAGLALLTGLMEPVGGLLGVVASTLADAALPMALAAAAGAMIWVVSHELIPASHRPGHETAGTTGLVSGFAVMTGLAVLL